MKWAPDATVGTVVAGGNGSGSALNQFDLAKIQAQTGSAETGLTASGNDAFGVQTGSSAAVYDLMDPKFSDKTTDYGSGETHVGA